MPLFCFRELDLCRNSGHKPVIRTVEQFGQHNFAMILLSKTAMFKVFGALSQTTSMFSVSWHFFSLMLMFLVLGDVCTPRMG